jgi:hypothetical protein
MEYVVDRDSSAMIYIPSFINICSLIQKLMEGGGGFTETTETHRQHSDHTSPLLFLKNKESVLKKK